MKNLNGVLCRAIEAEKLFDAGYYSQALSKLEEVIALLIPYGHTPREKGIILVAKRGVEECRQRLERLDKAKYLLKEAERLFQERNYAGALSAFISVIYILGSDSWLPQERAILAAVNRGIRLCNLEEAKVRLAEGQSLLEVGNYMPALKDFNLAIVLVGSFKDLPQAAEVITAALKGIAVCNERLTKLAEVKALIRKGMKLLFRKGSYKEALSIFDAVIEMFRPLSHLPKERNCIRSAKQGKNWCYERLAAIEKAEELIQKGIEEFNRGEYESAQVKFTSAKNMFSGSVSNMPQERNLIVSADSWIEKCQDRLQNLKTAFQLLNQGKSFFNENNYEEALKAFKTVIELLGPTGVTSREGELIDEANKWIQFCEDKLSSVKEEKVELYDGEGLGYPGVVMLSKERYERLGDLFNEKDREFIGQYLGKNNIKDADDVIQNLVILYKGEDFFDAITARFEKPWIGESKIINLCIEYSVIVMVVNRDKLVSSIEVSRPLYVFDYRGKKERYSQQLFDDELVSLIRHNLVFIVFQCLYVNDSGVKNTVDSTVDGKVEEIAAQVWEDISAWLGKDISSVRDAPQYFSSKYGRYHYAGIIGEAVAFCLENARRVSNDEMAKERKIALGRLLNQNINGILDIFSRIHPVVNKINKEVWAAIANEVRTETRADVGKHFTPLKPAAKVIKMEDKKERHIIVKERIKDYPHFSPLFRVVALNLCVEEKLGKEELKLLIRQINGLFGNEVDEEWRKVVSAVGQRYPQVIECIVEGRRKSGFTVMLSLREELLHLAVCSLEDISKVVVELSNNKVGGNSCGLILPKGIEVREVLVRVLESAELSYLINEVSKGGLVNLGQADRSLPSGYDRIEFCVSLACKLLMYNVTGLFCSDGLDAYETLTLISVIKAGYNHQIRIDLTPVLPQGEFEDILDRAFQKLSGKVKAEKLTILPFIRRELESSQDTVRNGDVDLWQSAADLLEGMFSPQDLATIFSEELKAGQYPIDLSINRIAPDLSKVLARYSLEAKDIIEDIGHLNYIPKIEIVDLNSLLTTLEVENEVKWQIYIALAVRVIKDTNDGLPPGRIILDICSILSDYTIQEEIVIGSLQRFSETGSRYEVPRITGSIKIGGNIVTYHREGDERQYCRQFYNEAAGYSFYFDETDRIKKIINIRSADQEGVDDDRENVPDIDEDEDEDPFTDKLEEEIEEQSFSMIEIEYEAGGTFKQIWIDRGLLSPQAMESINAVIGHEDFEKKINSAEYPIGFEVSKKFIADFEKELSRKQKKKLDLDIKKARERELAKRNKNKRKKMKDLGPVINANVTKTVKLKLIQPVLKEMIKKFKEEAIAMAKIGLTDKPCRPLIFHSKGDTFSIEAHSHCFTRRKSLSITFENRDGSFYVASVELIPIRVYAVTKEHRTVRRRAPDLTLHWKVDGSDKKDISSPLGVRKDILKEKREKVFEALNVYLSFCRQKSNVEYYLFDELFCNYRVISVGHDLVLRNKKQRNEAVEEFGDGKTIFGTSGVLNCQTIFGNSNDIKGLALHQYVYPDNASLDSNIFAAKVNRNIDKTLSLIEGLKSEQVVLLGVFRNDTNKMSNEMFRLLEQKLKDEDIQLLFLERDECEENGIVEISILDGVAFRVYPKKRNVNNMSGFSLLWREVRQILRSEEEKTIVFRKFDNFVQWHNKGYPRGGIFDSPVVFESEMQRFLKSKKDSSICFLLSLSAASPVSVFSDFSYNEFSAVLEKVKDMPAFELLKALNLREAQLISKREDVQTGLEVHTIRIPKRRNPLKPAVGLEILHNELGTVREFELLYNSRGYPIAIIPVLTEKILSRWIKRKQWLINAWDYFLRKLPRKKSGMRFVLSQVLSLIYLVLRIQEQNEKFFYFDFSPYYFKLPKIGESDSRTRWMDFVFRQVGDEHIIGLYLGFKGISQFIKKYNIRSRDDNEVQKSYVYMEFYPESNMKSMLQFDPSDLLKISRRDDLRYLENIFYVKEGCLQIVFPVLPTVYSPGLGSHAANDDEYLQLVYHVSKNLTSKNGDFGLVVGPGSGIDVWLLWLAINQVVYAIGINPFEIANTRIFAKLAGFEFQLKTFLHDNIITKRGRSIFGRIKFKVACINAPFYRPLKSSRSIIIDKLSERLVRTLLRFHVLRPLNLFAYSDSDTGRFIQGLAKGLSQCLDSREGIVILWNRTGYEKSVLRILELEGLEVMNAYYNDEIEVVYLLGIKDTQIRSASPVSFKVLPYLYYTQEGQVTVVSSPMKGVEKDGFLPDYSGWLHRRYMTFWVSRVRKRFRRFEKYAYSHAEEIDELAGKTFIVLLWLTYIENYIGIEYLDDFIFISEFELITSGEMLEVMSITEFEKRIEKIRDILIERLSHSVSAFSEQVVERCPKTVKKLWQMFGVEDKGQKEKKRKLLEEWYKAMYKTIGSPPDLERRQLVKKFKELTGSKWNYPIKIIALQLTQACDNNCDHCLLVYRTKSDVIKNQWSKIIKFWEDRGIKAFVITGGESITPEMIDEVVGILKIVKVPVYIITNGKKTEEFIGEINESVKDKIGKILLPGAEPFKVTLQLSMGSDFHQKVCITESNSLEEKISIKNHVQILRTVAEKFPQIQIGIFSMESEVAAFNLSDGTYKDPMLNRLFRELGEGYQCSIVPDVLKGHREILVETPEGNLVEKWIFKTILIKLIAPNGSEYKLSLNYNPILATGRAYLLDETEHILIPKIPQKFIQREAELLFVQKREDFTYKDAIAYYRDAEIGLEIVLDGNVCFDPALVNVWSLGNIRSDDRDIEMVMEEICDLLESDPLFHLMNESFQEMISIVCEVDPQILEEIRKKPYFGVLLLRLLGGPALRLYITKRYIQEMAKKGKISKQVLKELQLDVPIEDLQDEYRKNKEKEPAFITDVVASPLTIKVRRGIHGVFSSAMGKIKEEALRILSIHLNIPEKDVQQELVAKVIEIVTDKGIRSASKKEKALGKAITEVNQHRGEDRQVKGKALHKIIKEVAGVIKNESIIRVVTKWPVEIFCFYVIHIFRKTFENIEPIVNNIVERAVLNNQKVIFIDEVGGWHLAQYILAVPWLYDVVLRQSERNLVDKREPFWRSTFKDYMRKKRESLRQREIISEGKLVSQQIVIRKINEYHNAVLRYLSGHPEIIVIGEDLPFTAWKFKIKGDIMSYKSEQAYLETRYGDYLLHLKKELEYETKSFQLRDERLWLQIPEIIEKWPNCIIIILRGICHKEMHLGLDCHKYKVTPYFKGRVGPGLGPLDWLSYRLRYNSQPLSSEEESYLYLHHNYQEKIEEILKRGVDDLDSFERATQRFMENELGADVLSRLQNMVSSSVERRSTGCGYRMFSLSSPLDILDVGNEQTWEGVMRNSRNGLLNSNAQEYIKCASPLCIREILDTREVNSKDVQKAVTEVFSEVDIEQLNGAPKLEGLNLVAVQIIEGEDSQTRRIEKNKKDGIVTLTLVINTAKSVTPQKQLVKLLKQLGVEAEFEEMPLDKRIPRLERLIGQDSANQQAAVRLAKIYTKLNRHKDALEVLGRVRDASKKDGLESGGLDEMYKDIKEKEETLKDKELQSTSKRSATKIGCLTGKRGYYLDTLGVKGSRFIRLHTNKKVDNGAAVDILLACGEGKKGLLERSDLKQGQDFSVTDLISPEEAIVKSDESGAVPLRDKKGSKVKIKAVMVYFHDAAKTACDLLCEVLREAGIEAYSMGMTGDSESELSEYMRILKEENPTLVGISAYNEDLGKLNKIIKRINNALPQALIYLGGPATTIPKRFLTFIKATDKFVMIRGAATIVLPQIVKILHERGDVKEALTQRIQELVALTGGFFIRYEDIIIAHHLDKMNVAPTRIPHSKDEYGTNIWLTSQECPYNCLFCGFGLGHKRGFEPASVEDMMAWLHKEKPHVSNPLERIDIWDSNFMVCQERVEDFLRRVSESDLPRYFYFYIHQVHQNTLRTDETSLSLLVKSGVRYINDGLDDLNGSEMGKRYERYGENLIDSVIKKHKDLIRVGINNTHNAILISPYTLMPEFVENLVLFYLLPGWSINKSRFILNDPGSPFNNQAIVNNPEKYDWRLTKEKPDEFGHITVDDGYLYDPKYPERALELGSGVLPIADPLVRKLVSEIPKPFYRETIMNLMKKYRDVLYPYIEEMMEKWRNLPEESEKGHLYKLLYDKDDILKAIEEIRAGMLTFGLFSFKDYSGFLEDEASTPYDLQDIEATEKVLLEVIKEEPTLLGAYYILHAIYKKQNRVNDAIKLFRQGMKSAPQNKHTRMPYTLSYDLESIGEYYEALAVISDAYFRDMGNAQWQQQRILLMIKMLMRENGFEPQDMIIDELTRGYINLAIETLLLRVDNKKEQEDVAKKLMVRYGEKAVRHLVEDFIDKVEIDSFGEAVFKISSIPVVQVFLWDQKGNIYSWKPVLDKEESSASPVEIGERTNNSRVNECCFLRFNRRLLISSSLSEEYLASLQGKFSQLIDIHVHLTSGLDFCGLNPDQDTYLWPALVSGGVEGCVVMSRDNRITDQALNQYPKFRGYAWVTLSDVEYNFKVKDNSNTFMPRKSKIEDIIYFLEQNPQFIGIKLHPALDKVAVNSAEAMLYLEALSKLNHPWGIKYVVMLHSGGGYCEPCQIEELARRFTNINFILGHVYYGDEFWDKKVKAANLARILDNVYLEFSWVKPPEVLKIIKIAGASKVLFGSDLQTKKEHYFDKGYHYGELIRFLIKSLSEQDLVLVMSENAVELFKMDDFSNATASPVSSMCIGVSRDRVINMLENIRSYLTVSSWETLFPWVFMVLLISAISPFIVRISSSIFTIFPFIFTISSFIPDARKFNITTSSLFLAIMPLAVSILSFKLSNFSPNILKSLWNWLMSVPTSEGVNKSLAFPVAFLEEVFFLFIIHIIVWREGIVKQNLFRLSDVEIYKKDTTNAHSASAYWGYRISFDFASLCFQFFGFSVSWENAAASPVEPEKLLESLISLVKSKVYSECNISQKEMTYAYLMSVTGADRELYIAKIKGRITPGHAFANIEEEINRTLGCKRSKSPLSSPAQPSVEFLKGDRKLSDRWNNSLVQALFGILPREEVITAFSESGLVEDEINLKEALAAVRSYWKERSFSRKTFLYGWQSLRMIQPSCIVDGLELVFFDKIVYKSIFIRYDKGKCWFAEEGNIYSPIYIWSWTRMSDLNQARELFRDEDMIISVKAMESADFVKRHHIDLGRMNEKDVRTGFYRLLGRFISVDIMTFVERIPLEFKYQENNWFLCLPQDNGEKLIFDLTKIWAALIKPKTFCFRYIRGWNISSCDGWPKTEKIISLFANMLSDLYLGCLIIESFMSNKYRMAIERDGAREECFLALRLYDPGKIIIEVFPCDENVCNDYLDIIPYSRSWPSVKSVGYIYFEHNNSAYKIESLQNLYFRCTQHNRGLTHLVGEKGEETSLRRKYPVYLAWTEVVEHIRRAVQKGGINSITAASDGSYRTGRGSEEWDVFLPENSRMNYYNHFKKSKVWELVTVDGRKVWKFNPGVLKDELGRRIHLNLGYKLVEMEVRPGIWRWMVEVLDFKSKLHHFDALQLLEVFSSRQLSSNKPVEKQAHYIAKVLNARGESSPIRSVVFSNGIVRSKFRDLSELNNVFILEGFNPDNYEDSIEPIDIDFNKQQFENDIREIQINPAIKEKLKDSIDLWLPAVIELVTWNAYSHGWDSTSDTSEPDFQFILYVNKKDNTTFYFQGKSVQAILREENFVELRELKQECKLKGYEYFIPDLLSEQSKGFYSLYRLRENRIKFYLKYSRRQMGGLETNLLIEFKISSSPIKDLLRGASPVAIFKIYKVQNHWMGKLIGGIKANTNDKECSNSSPNIDQMVQTINPDRQDIAEVVLFIDSHATRRRKAIHFISSSLTKDAKDYINKAKFIFGPQIADYSDMDEKIQWKIEKIRLRISSLFRFQRILNFNREIEFIERFRPLSIRMALVVTERCNRCCRQCFIMCPHFNKKDMGREIFQKVFHPVDLIDSLHSTLDITGGEPLLTNVVNLLKICTFGKVTIVTNALAINNEEDIRAMVQALKNAWKGRKVYEDFIRETGDASEISFTISVHSKKPRDLIKIFWWIAAIYEIYPEADLVFNEIKNIETGYVKHLTEFINGKKSSQYKYSAQYVDFDFLGMDGILGEIFPFLVGKVQIQYGDKNKDYYVRSLNIRRLGRAIFQEEKLFLLEGYESFYSEGVFPGSWFVLPDGRVTVASIFAVPPYHYIVGDLRVQNVNDMLWQVIHGVFFRSMINEEYTGKIVQFIGEYHNDNKFPGRIMSQSSRCNEKTINESYYWMFLNRKRRLFIFFRLLQYLYERGKVVLRDDIKNPPKFLFMKENETRELSNQAENLPKDVFFAASPITKRVRPRQHIQGQTLKCEMVVVWSIFYLYFSDLSPPGESSPVGANTSSVKALVAISSNLIELRPIILGQDIEKDIEARRFMRSLADAINEIDPLLPEPNKLSFDRLSDYIEGSRVIVDNEEFPKLVGMLLLKAGQGEIKEVALRLEEINNHAAVKGYVILYEEHIDPWKPFFTASISAAVPQEYDNHSFSVWIPEEKDETIILFDSASTIFSTQISSVRALAQAQEAYNFLKDAPSNQLNANAVFALFYAQWLDLLKAQPAQIIQQMAWDIFEVMLIGEICQRWHENIVPHFKRLLLRGELIIRLSALAFARAPFYVLGFYFNQMEGDIRAFESTGDIPTFATAGGFLALAEIGETLQIPVWTEVMRRTRQIINIMDESEESLYRKAAPVLFQDVDFYNMELVNSILSIDPEKIRSMAKALYKGYTALGADVFSHVKDQVTYLKENTIFTKKGLVLAGGEYRTSSSIENIGAYLVPAIVLVIVVVEGVYDRCGVQLSKNRLIILGIVSFFIGWSLSPPGLNSMLNLYHLILFCSQKPITYNLKPKTIFLSVSFVFFYRLSTI
ncbi:MAG: amidohydrolase family protein [Candidatus Omnitrophota bacterium]|nr:MAG: amidohydrolase family protein [Candidatus Omnitrophota bacterium]